MGQISQGYTQSYVPAKFTRQALDRAQENWIAPRLFRVGIPTRDALSRERWKENPQLRVLTTQVETAVGVVQVDDNRLDVVEGHGLEEVVPQVEEVYIGRAHEGVRLELGQPVAAEVELAQLAQTVESVNRDELDAIVVELEHLQLRHLHEVAVADDRQRVVAQVEMLQAAQPVETVAGDVVELVAVQHELLQRGQVLERLVAHHADQIAIEVESAQVWQLYERFPGREQKRAKRSSGLRAPIKAGVKFSCFKKRYKKQ